MNLQWKVDCERAKRCLLPCAGMGRLAFKNQATRSVWPSDSDNEPFSYRPPGVWKSNRGSSRSNSRLSICGFAFGSFIHCITHCHATAIAYKHFGDPAIAPFAIYFPSSTPGGLNQRTAVSQPHVIFFQDTVTQALISPGAHADKHLGSRWHLPVRSTFPAQSLT